jgi:hypothetical protein
MKYPTRPADSYPPEEPPVAVPADDLAAVIEILDLFDEFLRLRASAATHAELAVFCVTKGWSGLGAAYAVIDALGLNARMLRRAAGIDPDGPGEQR